MEATFVLNLITLGIALCVFSYALINHISTLKYKKNKAIFEHKHLDYYDRIPLMELEHYVDTSMDEWDAEFCKQIPKTEEGKAFLNRRYELMNHEITIALKMMSARTGIHEINSNIIYPGKIIHEKDINSFR